MTSRRIPTVDPPSPAVVDAIATLLAQRIGYAVDIDGGRLQLRTLASGRFALSRHDERRDAPAWERAFDDPREAAVAFEAARRADALGFDFEWVELARLRAMVRLASLPDEDRVWAAGRLVDCDHDDAEFEELVQLAARDDLPAPVAEALGSSIARAVLRSGRAASVRERISEDARRGFHRGLAPR